MLVVLLFTSAFLFALGGATRSANVLGMFSVYALPVAAVVAFWWDEWLGSVLRPRWSGFLDTLVVAASGTLLARLGRAIVVGREPMSSFWATAASEQTREFAAMMPLGLAVFTVLLQLSLVMENWPLRRLPRLQRGAAALAFSWPSA